ncbi:MAG TPA: phytanoyl-CoA dioxygenase, partial [Chloroflexia bacterium]|nr:phytanoyl-CoA dioxygenase [Chloroflexia bacterium]
MGDISARSALTIHRGTPNTSNKPRPALVLGVDAPDARNAERHDLQITRAFYATLSDDLRSHITCRVVDELEPIHQGHTIEGLMMGEA